MRAGATGNAVRPVRQKRGLKNAMAFSRAFPQADQWSPEITVDDWDFAHKGPPIVPFRNLPCGPYRIKYSFGGGGDNENSLVLVLENAYGRQFAAWSPVSLYELADHISEAKFIDFVGFGAADEEYGFPPVVIRLSHPPDSSGCPDCAVFAKNNGKTDFGAEIQKCFQENGPSGSEPDYSGLIHSLREVVRAHKPTPPPHPSPSPALSPIRE